MPDCASARARFLDRHHARGLSQRSAIDRRDPVRDRGRSEARRVPVRIDNAAARTFGGIERRQLLRPTLLQMERAGAKTCLTRKDRQIERQRRSRSDLRWAALSGAYGSNPKAMVQVPRRCVKESSNQKSKAYHGHPRPHSSTSAKTKEHRAELRRSITAPGSLSNFPRH